MKVVHEWLKDYIGKDIPSPEKIEELLTFHSFEIEGVEKAGTHDVIDVDVLPNRSSDCLCHRGIAREVATVTDNSLVFDPFTEKVELGPISSKLRVSIDDPHSCTRFMLALMVNVRVEESPAWLRERLEALGQRSINNIVDVTNYIMLSLGQPLHAYDVMKFPQQDGVWHFGVRMAREGEKVTTLGGDAHDLNPTVQLIVDGSNDAPVGIAGVKGGAYAELNENTTVIAIEAAHFDPTVTRKAAQTLKLQTDASKRFENGVSPEVVPYALKEAVKMIEDMTEGVCEGYVDAYPTRMKQDSVQVTLSKINTLLGLSLTIAEVDTILDRLGFTHTREGDRYTITAPFERTDITITEDVVEEVGRIYGYEHVQSVVPEHTSLLEINARHYYSERIRTALIEEGFSEIITSSFRKKDEVKLQNALASDKAYLRSSLRKNITEALDKNTQNSDLLGLRDVRVFEIGTVFRKKEAMQGIHEYVSVALGVRTRQQGYSSADDEILKEAVINLEQVLNSSIDRTIEKGVVEFDLSALLETLPAPTAYEPYEESGDVHYKPYSTYPHVTRDIALWVTEGTDAEEVERILNDAVGGLRIRTTLFDEFTKDGKVSYAFRLVFQSFDRTLTDGEVNTLMENVYAAARGQGWEIR